MPITFSDGLASLTGGCIAEDADALLEWLRVTPEPRVDLAGCTAMHSAIVQLLMAATPKVAAAPAERDLAWAVAALLPAAHATSTEVSR